MYSPHDQLPAPEPRTIRPDEFYFYDNTIKYLVKDVVRIMANGIPIDLKKVRELESTIDNVLEAVDDVVQNHSLIKEFQKQQHKYLIADFIEETKAKMKPASHFLKSFDCSNAIHRSYLMHIIGLDDYMMPPSEDIIYYSEDCVIYKWSARDVKERMKTCSHPTIKLLDAKQVDPTNRYAVAAMKLLAEHKAELYNRKYQEMLDKPPETVPPFNIGSSKQKQLFFSFLNIESESQSKTTGLPSWSRDEIERVNKETAEPLIKEITQAFSDYSSGAIIKQNFIPAFYKYTVDGNLYGTLRLFGAKTFRLTSQDPNLLNMPSTKSIYSKPVKKCFIAPPGYIILTADFGALEDRVIASLTRDNNKCRVFTDGLDGHCLNAYGYFKDEIAQYMELTHDLVTDVKEFYRLVEEGHKELKAIRQKGKPVTFGLSYGAYPPKVSKTLKVPLEDAEKIFNSYHNELYGGITKYREEYILPTAKLEGKIHLGLGCYLQSNNAKRDIRTLNNASCQFWSILTLLTINKLHQDIDINNMSDDIKCISTIYDSIYFIVKEDAHTIKWLNDRLIKYMTTDFMENQAIKNEATAEIGYDWATLHKIPNNASIKEIEEVLQQLKEH